MSADWGRTLVAVVTPMQGTQVNCDLAAKLCRDIIAQGCHGVIVAGTTGEAATLTTEEKLDLFTRIKAEVGGAGKVIAGVGSNCTRTTVDLIQRAEALDLDGYMVITPYYNKPNLSGLLEHFQAADQASSRPIMLYNVPSRTGMDLGLEGYRAVLELCPKVTAVKEASPDLERASLLVAEHRNISFFSGNDSLTLPMMAVGFEGVVSVAGNVVPRAMAQLTKLAATGKWDAARALHNSLLPLFKALFVETNPVPVKAALEIQGWPVGRGRLPLGPLDSQHWAMLKELLPRYSREGH